MQNPGCSRIAQIAHNVDVEEIFKGPPLERPRFQVCHVHAVIEKVSQDDTIIPSPSTYFNDSTNVP